MEVSPEETDEECRAKIPPLLSQAERDALAYAPECRQRWGSRQTADATPLMGAEDIEEFRTEFAQLKENELALQCLFDSEFDVPRAVGLLHTGRRARRKAQNDQDERLQLEKFEEAIRTYDKKFHLVKKALGHKVLTREVVSKYYLWKSTEGFQEWRRRQKAKKKKEVERLYWGEDLESEKEARPNYHHDRCELCSTGAADRQSPRPRLVLRLLPRSYG
ncbi:hypothetical protein PHYBOEH_001170 [Phytophthora boehmeriae]|uniref:SANT domain-containing protein n=1 Tax=Phytophthora boehmeriae TaxID=109152 RepID=A0A8T1WUQ5_9STRA|nr:hypothetical protein PHYBOEH_001170 [Phytophthora boehmeriae]